MPKTLTKKIEHLQNTLKDLNNVLVAFSGGIDSTFLLTIAKKTLHQNVHAITIQTPLTPKREITEASHITKSLKIPHQIITIDLFQELNIKTNQKNRCYLCKKLIFTHLKKTAEKQNQIIIEGSNADDQQTYRPGTQALKELTIQSPLKDAGFTKKEIRTASKQLGIPNWNKPATPCLATRFPYNTDLTKQQLNQVEQAEDFLNSIGFPHNRVRHHANLARIEVPKHDIPQLLTHTNQITKTLLSLGYEFVTIDLNGYTSGCYDGEDNEKTT